MRLELAVDGYRVTEENRVVATPSSVKCSAGFTIVELLVSISVFVFITSIVVFGFRGAGQANDLRQSAAALVADVRRIQTLTQSRATVTLCRNQFPRKLCTSSSDCNFVVQCNEIVFPAGGYGLNAVASSSQYSIFADLATVTNPAGDGVYTANDDVIISAGTVTMPSGTRLLSLSKTDVTFDPVRATPIQADPIYYCLEHQDIAGRAWKVTVLKASGQVQEQAVTSCL